MQDTPHSAHCLHVVLLKITILNNAATQRGVILPYQHYPSDVHHTQDSSMPPGKTK